MFTVKNLLVGSIESVKTVLAIAFVLAATSGMASATCGCEGVPELDPNSMAAAASLLAGGVAMLTDKVRRKN